MVSRSKFQEFRDEHIRNFNQVIEDLRGGTSIKELFVVFGLIPSFLILIEGLILSNYWILADITRDQFYLDYVGQRLFSIETLVETYLSSIAHSGWSEHLLPNLKSYYLCMLAFYPMAALSTQKEKVRKLFVFLILASPIFITLMNFQNPMGVRSLGFSGVLSAYFGLLPVVIFDAVDGQIESNLDPFWSATVIILVYGSIFLYLGSFVYATLMGVLTLVFFTGFLVFEGKETLLQIVRIVSGFDYVIFLWAIAVAIAGAVGMYYKLPPDANIVSHIAGYMFGFLAGFLYLGDHLNKPDEGWRLDKSSIPFVND